MAAPVGDDDRTSGRAGEDSRLRLRRRLAPWLTGLPYLVLAVMWIGFLSTLDDPAGMGWIAIMWCSCLVLLPLAVVGAVWARSGGDRGTMWGGIIAAVICLPGFVMGLFALPSVIASIA